MSKETTMKQINITNKIMAARRIIYLILLLAALSFESTSAQVATTHNVLWIGTSIPAGCRYPEGCCSNLGWKCYNMSLGASGICVNDGFLNNARDGKDLSETKEEKAKRYEQYIGYGDMTTDYYEEMLNYGFENRLIPYIDGTKASCDIVVFDHGYNDRLGANKSVDGDMKSLYESFENQNKEIDRLDEDFDRSNFIEAFCFLLKKMREVNPNIFVVICSHIENTSGSPDFDDLQSRYGYYTCLVQEKLASYFGFPYLNICDYVGFTMDVMPNSSNYLEELNNKYGTNFSRIVFNTKQKQAGQDLITYFQYYCPDGVHPHTDPTGQSEKKLTEVVTSQMKEFVLPKLCSIGTTSSDVVNGNRIYGIDGIVRNNNTYGVIIRNHKKYFNNRTNK